MVKRSIGKVGPIGKLEDIFSDRASGDALCSAKLSALIQRPVTADDLMNSVGTTSYVAAGFHSPHKPYEVAAQITKSDSEQDISLKDFITLSANKALLEIRADTIKAASRIKTDASQTEVVLYSLKEQPQADNKFTMLKGDMHRSIPTPI